MYRTKQIKTTYTNKKVTYLTVALLKTIAVLPVLGPIKQRLSKQTSFKRTLFNKIRQYNIPIFDKIIFFMYRTKQIKLHIQIRKLLILR